MAGRVALDLVPALVRPEQVGKALAEASELRDRARQAQEQVAAAQAALDEAEKQDVEAAAQRARSGQPLGTTPAGVTKARSALEAAKRTSAALTLALEGAEGDLVAALTVNGSAWVEGLDDESGRARQRAATALTEFQAALADLAKAAAAALWVRGALGDGRWDRPLRQASAGTVAPSGAKVSANGEPFAASDLIAWAQELITPPAPPPSRHLTHAKSAADAA